MFTRIDRFLNGITMYRLVLYELLALCAAAAVFMQFQLVSGDPFFFFISVAFIVAMCWAANTLFSAAFKAPTNVESVYISALILALIITPAHSWTDAEFFTLAGWASLLAMGSKYILAVRHKHFFNPVALAVALTAVAANQSASWWVGTLPMLPFVTVGGLLITRKIHRFDLVFSFFVVALFTVGISRAISGSPVGTYDTLTTTAIVFFATVMLTEPLTTPPRRWQRIAYGALTGLLFAPDLHIGSLYATPELALLGGNILSYILSPKAKLLLTLKEKIQLTPDTFDFVFEADGPMPFFPGQYLEWTLPHDHPDSRGNRRYFTIASAPEEAQIHLGVKFYEPGSSFKRSLHTLKDGDIIGAGQLAGDFILPSDPSRKLVFLAGGIGITPFRSMTAAMIAEGEKRSVTLLYSNKTPADIAYRDVFDEAAQKIGMKNVYTLTDVKAVPSGWTGRMGRIDAAMIREEVPDFAERMFYISGTHGMVETFENALHQMGVSRIHIVKDYFPGF